MSRGQSVSPGLRLLRKYPAREAIQGVAVDARHFYAIDNTAIGKYERDSGRKVGEFDAKSARPEPLPLIHMDGGMVFRGKIYCSHSNFPATPMESSIEVFDASTLRHLSSQSFGRDAGSLVWVDFHAGSWWVCFGHYNGKGGEPGKPNTLTTLVRYDLSWRKIAGYTFPEEIVKRWDGMTASGGLWGPNETLIVTSHHAPEFYLFQIPRAGSELKIKRIVASVAEGQGLAITPDFQRLFQIQRRERAVYEFDLTILEF